MLSVFLIWIYIFLTTAVIGLALLHRTTFELDARLMFGLMVVTIYSEIFSIFYKVGLAANIVLVVLCIVLAIVFRKKISTDIKEFAGKLTQKKAWPVYPVLALIFLAFMVYGTSRGFMHYDSDLYHSQSIRWIEEYGVVKGLGNLHFRLAYNSASFALSALYSFSFLGGQSYHAVPGYLTTILLAFSLRIFKSIRQKKIGISDFARLGIIYYCFNIYDEMVSPASDYFAMLFFMYVIVKIIEVSESDSGEDRADKYAALAMMAVFTITVKVSTAPVIIVAITPIVMLAKERNIKKILFYIAGAVTIALPYFIREYIISGRLLYPSTMPDIFSPIWKVPESIAKRDAADILACARGYGNAEAAEYPFKVWFPHWLDTLSKTEKIMFAASICLVIILPVSIIVKKKIRAFHVAEITCILSFLFWFFTAPLIRYGQGYLLILPVIIIGDAAVMILDKVKTKSRNADKFNRYPVIVFTVLVSLFLCYKFGNAVLLCKDNYAQGCYIKQLDYGNYDLEARDVDGVVIYSSPNHGQTGYDPFPSTPYAPPDLRLIGNDIKSGFYIPQ